MSTNVLPPDSLSTHAHAPGMDTVSALKKLLHPNFVPTIQLIGKSALLRDVLVHTEGNDNWQISPESLVIKAHFP